MSEQTDNIRINLRSSVVKIYKIFTRNKICQSWHCDKILDCVLTVVISSNAIFVTFTRL